MEHYADKLDRFMVDHGIPFKRFRVDAPVYNSKQAADSMGCSTDDIVKTIIMVDKEGSLHSATLRGCDKMRRDPIKRRVGADDLHMENPDAIEKRIGYPIGGVPPLGYDATFVVDSSLEGHVHAGGGEPHTMVRVHVDDILDVTGAEYFSFASRDE